MRSAKKTIVTWLGLVFVLGNAVPTIGQNQWQRDIDAWVAQDALNPPPENAVLFVGSSSMWVWQTLTYDFSQYDIIQRGFGGSQFSDLNQFVDEIVLAYDPAAIVVFEGSNDVNAGKSAEQVFADYLSFVQLVHNGQRPDRPPIPIVSVGITPTPTRWSDWGRASQANARIEEHTRVTESLYYVDTPARFLASATTPGGPPSRDLFVTDGVHLNAQGYQIWTEEITPVVETVVPPSKAYASNPHHPPVGSRLLLDLGPSNGIDGNHTVSPDINGNHWNNWHTIPGPTGLENSLLIAPGQSLGDLVTTQGTHTGIDLVITGAFKAVGINHGGLLSPDSANLNEYAISTATQDFFGFAGDPPSGAFMLTGLDPNLRYDFEFFSSRRQFQSETTGFHARGRGVAVTATLQSSGVNIGSDGQYDGNDSETARAVGVRPDGFGRVFVDVDTQGAPLGYINLLDIVVRGYAGDFDDNGLLEAHDMDLLSEQVRLGHHPRGFDLNDDGLVDQADRAEWILAIRQTRVGDADLSGSVDDLDFAAWKASRFTENTTWSTGDFNGDGRTDGADFNLWNANKGSSIREAALPEPGGTSWMLLVAFSVVFTRALHGASAPVPWMRADRSHYRDSSGSESRSNNQARAKAQSR